MEKYTGKNRKKEGKKESIPHDIWIKESIGNLYGYRLVVWDPNAAPHLLLQETLALPFFKCVTFDKLLNLLPQFSHLESGF